MRVAQSMERFKLINDISDMNMTHVRVGPHVIHSSLQTQSTQNAYDILCLFMFTIHSTHSIIAEYSIISSQGILFCEHFVHCTTPSTYIIAIVVMSLHLNENYRYGINQLSSSPLFVM